MTNAIEAHRKGEDGPYGPTKMEKFATGEFTRWHKFAAKLVNDYSPGEVVVRTRKQDDATFVIAPVDSFFGAFARAATKIDEAMREISQGGETSEDEVWEAVRIHFKRTLCRQTITSSNH